MLMRPSNYLIRANYLIMSFLLVFLETKCLGELHGRENIVILFDNTLAQLYSITWIFLFLEGEERPIEIPKHTTYHQRLRLGLFVILHLTLPRSIEGENFIRTTKLQIRLSKLIILS